MVCYYNKDIKEELPMKDSIFFLEWYSLVKDILLHDEFQRRKLFPHHHDKSVFMHSVEVSFAAFVAAKYFKADAKVCAIAGLLHDFYPKAWLYSEELEELDSSYLSELTFVRPLFQKHGFTHASQALENAKQYFPSFVADKKVCDAIKRHMFPLNIIPPKYKESWIITIIDKKNSIFELPSIRVVPKKVGNKIYSFVHSIK